MWKICIKILTSNFTRVTYKMIIFYSKKLFSVNIYLFDHSSPNSSSGHDIHKHVAEQLLKVMINITNPK